MGKEELYAQQSSKESEKAEYEREKAIIKEKLERLRAAKSQVASIKTNIKSIKKEVKKQVDQEDNWKGDKYNEYHFFTSDTFMNSYDSYLSNVDFSLDEICDEITRLENQLSDIDGIIGCLIDSINSLCNEIEKLFN